MEASAGMLNWWMRMGRRVRPWVVAVGLCGALAAGCPAEVLSVMYGPATVYGPAPVDGLTPVDGPPRTDLDTLCRGDAGCAYVFGAEWVCTEPADPVGSSWGECLPPQK
jgi:hypothetical protein